MASNTRLLRFCDEEGESGDHRGVAYCKMDKRKCSLSKLKYFKVFIEKLWNFEILMP